MRLLTLGEIARRLGVSDKTARKFAAQIPGSVRVNNRIRYTEDGLAEFVRRRGCSAEHVATL